MKKLSLLFLFTAIAFISFGQLATSAHDFTDGASITGGLGNDNWNTLATNHMCGPCHTPHGGNSAASGPLWSHDISVAAFTVYTSPFGTLDAGALGQPSGVSLFCLSCHDGTVNLNAHNDGADDTPISGTGLVGTDLGDDHPVSFTYDAALATLDGELYNPVTQNSGLGGTINDDMLFGGNMECGSCHDVHNAAGLAINQGLLVMSNANSALCLTCHNK